MLSGCLEDASLGFDRRLKRGHTRSKLLGIHMQSLGDCVQMLRLQVFLRKVYVQRRIVIDNYPAIAIEDFSARGKQRSLSSLKDSKLCKFPPCPILQRQVIFGWQRRRVEAAARRFTSYGREARGDRFIAVALRWREIHPSFVPDYASALRWSFGGSLQPQRFRLTFSPYALLGYEPAQSLLQGERSDHSLAPLESDI